MSDVYNHLPLDVLLRYWGDRMDGESRPGSPDPSKPAGLNPVRGEPSEVNRPIFVAGCHRSGTSVLRRSLDSHPRISAGPEETTLFWLARCDDELGQERRSGYGVYEEEWLAMVRAMSETFHLRYAASAAKTRWALKLPENVLVIDFLDKLYPDCQIIHIVRNPRDVIASNRRKYGPRKDSFYGERWAHYVRTAERLGPPLARKGSGRFATRILCRNRSRCSRTLSNGWVSPGAMTCSRSEDGRTGFPQRSRSKMSWETKRCAERIFTKCPSGEAKVIDPSSLSHMSASGQMTS